MLNSNSPAASSKSAKKPKIRADQDNQEFLFPQHLPVDIGAECTDFLSIQEQCRIHRTSTQIGEFVQRALGRVHEKGVVVLSAQKTTHAHDCICMKCFKMVKEWTFWEAQKIVKVSGACPRIERFYFLRTDKKKIQTKPIKFYIGWRSYQNKPILSALTLCGIASSKHIKCLDLYINRNLPHNDFERVLKQLPHLRTLNLSLCAYDHFKPESLESITDICDNIPVIHFKAGSFWHGEYQRAVCQWKTLRSLSFNYGGYFSRQVDEKIFNTVMHLPESVTRVNLSSTFNRAETVERTRRYKSFKKTMGVFLARSPGWEGELITKGKRFDEESNKSWIRLDLMSDVEARELQRDLSRKKLELVFIKSGTNLCE